MRLYQLMVSEHIGAVSLYLVITLAGIDYSGILDYALKAALGSGIWFGFRMLGDYYSAKVKRSVNHNKKNQQP
jgi:hypothetical protein